MKAFFQNRWWFALFTGIATCCYQPLISQSAFGKIDTVARLETPGGKVLRLEKSFRNIPVWGAQAVLLIAEDAPHQVSNSAWDIRYQNPKPFPDYRPETEDALTSYLTSHSLTSKVCDRQPVWFPQGDELQPAWRFITCSGAFNGNREIIFHAEKDHLLFDESRLAYFTQDTTVRALVFNPDPLTRAGLNYGLPYADQNDGDVPELNALRDTVMIRVTLVGDTFYLRGNYIELKDLESPDDEPVRQDHPDFFYSRSHQGFEDVMVYYHMQEWQTYIRSLGFTTLCDFPMWVDSHGLNGADNSYFSPGSNRFDGYLAFGDGGVDDGEDADVIVHEYGHALSYDAAPGTNFGTERRGLDEGICDYFAAAYSKDLNSFRWNEIYTWDGHNEFWAGRLADQNLIYPITGFDIYTFGSLWATVMMEIRQALGANITDRLQLQALYLNVSNNTLPQAARNILIADTALYGGVHSPTLLQYFCARQLLTGPDCNGIQNAADWDNPSLVLFPNPSTERFYLSGYSGSWEVIGLNGKRLLDGEGEVINLVEFPSGIYILRVGDKRYKLIKN